MKKIVAVFAFALIAGCATSGNHCSTSTCSSSGPNNGKKVTTCADATVGIGVATESGSISYDGHNCSWSGTGFASAEEACLQAEENWCNPQVGLDQ